MRNYEVTLTCKKCGAVQTFEIEANKLYKAIIERDLEGVDGNTEKGASWKYKERAK